MIGTFRVGQRTVQPMRSQWLMTTACLTMLWLALDLLLVWPAHAAADVVVGNGTPGSCTEAALVTALAAGGTVTFNCGDAPHTINFTEAKTLNVATVIDGEGKITLSGNDTTRLFNIAADTTVTLLDISVIDAPNSASAIFNAGKLIVQDAVFRNNLRGAIYNAGGDVMITDSTFEENQRSAVTNENEGTLTVAGSTFRRNTIPAPFSGNGGGVYSPNGATTITHSHFEQNSAGDGGGAIYNSGVMTVEQTTVIDNEAYGGGGIYTNDMLTIRNSRISGNRAVGANGAGGGIQHFNQSASPSSLTIEQTTIDGNESASQGGGLWVSGALATYTLVNTTIYSNTANNNGGGGLYVTSADGTLTNVTLSDNNAVTSDGDNVENSIDLPGTISLRNTLVDGGGCVGAVTDSGGNLEFPGSSCGFATLSADPGLGALTAHGGWTPTLAIAEGGPAQNTGVNANCPATDQRGVLRAQFVTCDIGAFEWGAQPVLVEIAPSATLALSPTLTLVVEGTNFIAGTPATRVLWDDEPLPTTYVSATEVRATVAASRIVAGGEVSVTVETPVVDGGVSAHTAVFTIAKRDQAIDFAVLADRGLEPTTFTVDATASSGLEVSFTAAGVCTVVGKMVSLTGTTGECTITAQQAGNVSYHAAPDVAHSFMVTDDMLMFMPSLYGAVAAGE